MRYTPLLLISKLLPPGLYFGTRYLKTQRTAGLLHTASFQNRFFTYYYILLAVLPVSVDAVASQQAQGSCQEKAAPVCGSDGLSYYNDCLATVQGVKVEHTGYCKGTHSIVAAMQ